MPERTDRMSEALPDLARRYLEALLRGRKDLASRVITDAVAAGTSVEELYLGVFEPSQYEVGRLWETNQISVAQEHYCTAAAQLIISQLYPYIFNSPRKNLRMVGTCIAGELHELGIRMVSDFFELQGWDTYYLGANTPADSVIKTVVDRQAQILAISTTLSAQLERVAELIAKVRIELDGFPVRVMVGGYAFNVGPGLWRQVGADGSGVNAKQAVVTGTNLVQAI